MYTEQELLAYKVAIEARYVLWAQYMRGEIGAQSVPRWPERPTRTPHPRPLVVWFHRPAGVPAEVESPSYYDLRCKPYVSVAGIRFRKGSGRNVQARATRNGRISWKATVEKIFSWQNRETEETKALEDALRAIQDAAGTAALNTLPSLDFECDGRGGKILRLPGGGYVCVFGWGRSPSISDLHVWHGNLNHTLVQAVADYRFPKTLVTQLEQRAIEKWGVK